MKTKTLFFSTLLLLSFVSNTTLAKQVEIKVASVYKFKKKALEEDFKVAVELGKETIIPIGRGLDAFELKLKTSPGSLESSPEPGIKFQGTVTKVSNGIKKVLSKPDVVATMGNESTYTVETAEGEFYEIRFVPIKINE